MADSAGRLAGRVAIVTGAGRGIGAATARLFSSEGARLVVCDRDADPLGEVVSHIQASGGDVRALAGDCADPSVAATAAASALDAFGAIDVLVNNAGLTADEAFHVMGDDAWAAPYEAMVLGTVRVTRACLPAMRDAATAELTRDGVVAHQRKITNTAAAAWLTGSPGQANLTAAAGAVVGLTRTLARELGPFGINVNAVAPGFIGTRLTTPQAPEGGLGVAEPIRQMTKAMTALGRHGSPDDVARVHLFLASPDADFVTGVTLPVSGGLLGTMV